MAFTVDVKSALVFAVAIPCLSVIVFGILLITIPLYRKTQSKLDSVMSITRENLTGVRVIRAFCKEDSEEIEFNKRNDSLNNAQRLVGRISALMNPLTYVIINFAVLFLISVSGKQVYSGNLSQGDVVALYNYMSQILIELIKLANLIVTITKSIACANRVAYILSIDEPDEQIASDGEKQSGNDCFIEFRNVSLTYKNASEDSLSDISFGIKKGETLGIIGGTGAGKTSLVNLIPHFYDATSGAVFVDGKDVKSYDSEKLRRKIGIVMQKAVLFKGTIRSNLGFADRFATDDEMIEALKSAQAYDFVMQKGGLDAEVAQGGRNFSGGQKQRLTIARALVGNPEILILDDSASALDYATDAALRKAIRELKSRPTVIIVSQRTSSLMHADKIVVLDDGKIVGEGRHEDLLESCEVYKEIYYSQYPKEVG